MLHSIHRTALRVKIGILLTAVLALLAGVMYGVAGAATTTGVTRGSAWFAMGPRYERALNTQWRFTRVTLHLPRRLPAFHPDSAQLKASGGLISTASFAAFKGRYVAIQFFGADGKSTLAGISELQLLGVHNLSLPRQNWRILYVDSDKLQPHWLSGAPKFMLDGCNSTAWLSQWALVHCVVLDLGEDCTITGLHIVRDRHNCLGNLNKFRIYASDVPFVLPAQWRYNGPALQGIHINDSNWESVTLPHTAKIEPASDQFPWQGICWYRRTLKADPAWKDQQVYIRIGAAMQIADVWVNGVHKIHHLGGYLPFTINITKQLQFDKPNIIAVRVDNRDTALTPPGKDVASLDFNYPGGIYRPVRLIVTDTLHVQGALRADMVVGGGVFIATRSASDAAAVENAKTDVVNDASVPARQVRIVSTILSYPDRRVLATDTSKTMTIAGNGRFEYEQTLHVANPPLWSPHHPRLCILHTQVFRGPQDKPVLSDQVETQFGIRWIVLAKHALMINGKPYLYRGTNRHQEYPYIEYAASNNAELRDAREIIGAGFNSVRLSHYPQSPAFLYESDQIGLMPMEAVPGWQIFHKGHSFINGCYTDVQQMIRRDRNHPSMVFWEVGLNETYDPLAFAQKMQLLAHREMPGNQCFTFGSDNHGHIYDLGGAIWREYGDWNFGGNVSTSRATRAAGQRAMLLQAWNFIWTDNNILNRLKGNFQFFGDGNWSMFDYNRGYYPVQAYCGDMDIFRLPKFIYYFYQSQRDPRDVIPGVASGPTVFIANYWMPQASPAKVVVFSNCQQVALYLNGRLIAKQSPDHSPDTRYGKTVMSLKTYGKTAVHTARSLFDGGNCRNLEHPPFTFFNVPYRTGKLEAIGYINGKSAAHDTVYTPGKPVGLRVWFDTQHIALAADGADTVFAHADIIDRHGEAEPLVDNAVAFSVKGPGVLIGANPFNAQAGIASILLRAGLQPGMITVTATARGLPPASAGITSVSPKLNYFNW